MKKSSAVLGLLCILLLSACRVVPPSIDATPVPPTPVQTVPPVQESATPEPGEETVPPSQLIPVPSPTDKPKGLTAEELTELSRQWSVTQANRFAGHDAFALPKTYWFADHTAGVEYVAYTTADGQDGAVQFTANLEGTIEPLEAAARLLNQSAAELILTDRTRMLEGLERRMAALAEEEITEIVALDRFHQAVGDIPALGEEMWYCVSAENTGYILMAHEGVYRLQRMAAMTEYAEMPVFRVNIDFDKAEMAYDWFHTAPMPTQPHGVTDSVAPPVVQGELVFYKVNYPGISSMLELRTYLKGIFSDEIVDSLLGMGCYTEADGVLYAAQFPTAEGLPQGQVTVSQENPTRIVYKRGADYVYEQVGDKWVFTEFPATT